MAKEIRKYLDYGNGYRIDITNDTGLAEFFPAPRNLEGQWVYPKLVIMEEHNVEPRRTTKRPMANKLFKSTKPRNGSRNKKIR